MFCIDYPAASSSMMATRKLKFKPKPILGSNIRRLPVRDNDEISVPTTVPGTEKEPSLAIKPVEILKESDESHIGRCILPTKDSGEAGKDLHNEKPISGEKNKGVSDNEPVCQNVPECIIQGNPIDPSNAGTIESAKHSVTTDSVLKTLPDLNSSGFQPPEDIGCETMQNLSANREDNGMETGDNNVKTKSVAVKVDVLKSLPRFGRSRCKPVLTCGPRKNATRISYDETILDNASVVARTESVIKSVQCELSKMPAEPIESELNTLPKTSDEIINHEDGADKVSMVREREMVNSSTIETKELVANKSSSLESASDEAIDVTDLRMLQQIPTKDDFRSSDAIITKPNKIEIPNQPIEAVHRSNENVKEFEFSNTSQSLQTPKVPLSPLRATSKMLVPKPSPRIRDGIRRISFQGSDSEEDSKRRKELTNSKDKDKKGDFKTVKRKKSHGSTYSKMGEETLQKFYEKFGKYDKPDKSKLTMMDLIFYNPKDNPMSKTQPKVHTSAGKKEIKIDVSEEKSDILAEQSVDDVEPTEAIPVPQLKIGPDGQIILDPKSLVIETTGTQKSREELEKSQVIQESGITRYSTYSKRKPRRSDWSAVETLQFYKALTTIGPDFTLMTQLFPKRSRHDLKLKFKKEDKLNRVLVDKAMTGQVDFDFKTLQEELKRENEEIEKKNLERELNKRQQKEKKLKAIAEKKQLAVDKKENKKNVVRKRRKTPCSAEILDTDEDTSDEEAEKQKVDAIMKLAKSRRPVLKKLKKYSSDVKNEIKDIKSPIEDTNSHKPSPRGAMKTRKLNEYHEMNESLKKNLCSDSAIVNDLGDSDAEDRYTPNGPDVDALFRSPPLTTDQPDDEQWNIDITSVPPIEEAVLENNIENVSEISELGSFGQDSDMVLDLSMTNRTLEHRPYLDRRIISESMEIVDQLSAHVENKTCVKKPDSSENEGSDTILPLPSFETVIGIRPSFRYPLETSDTVTDSQASEETGVEIRTSNKDLEVSDYQDQSELILGD